MNPSTKKLDLTPSGIPTFRISLGLTQEELGERLDVSGNYVWMLESAKKPIGAKIARKLTELADGPKAADPIELEKWRSRAEEAEAKLAALKAELGLLLKKI
jgi:transcriptional regulator with XRE-family HTH domain